MKKEDIYLDLRKLSKDEIKSIPTILAANNEDVFTDTSKQLLRAEHNYPFLSFDAPFWVSYINVDLTTKTEITFSDFKNLFRDYEKEMLEMLKKLVDLKERKDIGGKDEYYNEEMPKAWRSARQLIKEVEASHES